VRVIGSMRRRCTAVINAHPILTLWLHYWQVNFQQPLLKDFMDFH
jgi:hypothetical protein